MKCCNCGAELPDGSRFCLHCGTPQSEATFETTVEAGIVPPEVCPDNQVVSVSSEYATGSKSDPVFSDEPDGAVGKSFFASMKAASFDAATLIENLKAKIRPRTLMIAALVVILLILSLVSASAFFPQSKTKHMYRQAVSLKKSGNYEDAIATFQGLSDYKDSPSQIQDCHYLIALDLKDNGDYEGAIKRFQGLGSYRDSANQISKCQESLYNTALKYIGTADYSSAYDVLTSSYLDEFKDVEEQLNSIRFKCTDKWLSEGNIITFGNYEQDNNTSTGKEKIQWIVLNISGDSVLLLSQYILDAQQYHSENLCLGDPTWDDCDLRSWLNKAFYTSAFSQDEQEVLIASNLETDDSLGDAVRTTDSVFLLSSEEISQYYTTNAARTASATAYAISRGAARNSGKTWYWLRNSGNFGFLNSYATSIDNDGSISRDTYVDKYGGVRPAIWISLDKLEEYYS